MKEIKLTNDKFAIVDDKDHEYLNQFKWHFSNGYACRHIKTANGNDSKITMHQEIMQTPKGMETDHVNLNKLDNKRSNLRIVTKKQNSFNKQIGARNKSGYKGVSWFKRDSRWVVHIKVNGRTRNLGYFNDIKEAARRYNQVAQEHFGEFAYLNQL